MKKAKAPALAPLHARVGQILAANGNRLMLIEAIAMLLINVMLYVSLYTAFSLLLDALFASLAPWSVFMMHCVYWLSVTLLTLFFSFPLLLGLLQISADMANGTETSLLRLFSPFCCGKSYLTAVRLSLGALWRIVLIVLAVALTCGLTLRFFAGLLWAGILCGILVVVEIALWSLLVLRRFPTLAVVTCESMPLPRARAVARRMTRRCPFGSVAFWLHFLPGILLGLLTFGIFLIWEVLPRMCVTYFLYCRRMNEMIIESEEYKEHE